MQNKTIQTIAKILSEVFENVEVGAKLANKTGFLGTETRGYPVTATGESFYVRSAAHARKVVEATREEQADRAWSKYIMSDAYKADFASGTVKPRSSF